MKRLIILLTILLFASTNSFAQKKIDKELWLGAKGGITYSQLSIAPNIKQSMEMGTFGGVSMKYIEECFFGLILELNYAQKGWKEKFEDKDAAYQYSRTLNYIELPFLAHVYFGKKSFRFFIYHPSERLFLYSKYEYMVGIITIAKIIIINKIVKSNSPAIVITIPPIIQSFPASLCVLSQFSSSCNVHGSLIPTV